jgi:hypothetical protein
MDRRNRRYFTLGIYIAFVAVLAFMGYSYFKYGAIPVSTSIFLVVGVSVGVCVSYFIYNSFFEREREMTFEPDEQVILQRKYPDKSVIIPQIIGHGDAAAMSPNEVNLYLTNMGIVAETPGSGEPVLYIPFGDIQEMQTINRLLLKYIRIRYIDHNNLLAEVLLYVGKDTDRWAESIGRMIVG